MPLVIAGLISEGLAEIFFGSMRHFRTASFPPDWFRGNAACMK
jgi:hypothetical protein